MAGAFDAGTVTGRLILDLNDWSANIEKAKADTTSLAGVINAKKDDIEKLGKTFTAMGGAIVVALGAAIKKTADYGDELIKTSQRTGIATETLSGYKLAADKADLSLSALAGGLAKMTRNIGEAVSGNKDMQATLDKIGLKATDASGKMRSMDDLLGDVAEKFSQMPDGVEKSTLAMELFGRGGAQMIPLLNAGREGLKAEREEAERLGLVMSEKAAKSGEIFNDQITTLQKSFMGIAIVIGQALIPIVTKIADTFTSVVVVIRRAMEVFPPLTNLVTLAAGAFGGLLTIVGPMLYLLPKLSSAWLTISNLIPIIGARIAALSATMTLSVPIYAAIAAAIYIVVKAIDAYSASCDEAISDIYRTATENKRNWDFIRETIHGSNEKIKESIQSARVRLTEMGYTAEEVGTIVYNQFKHMAKGAAIIKADTLEMAQTVEGVLNELIDKTVSLTRNEYEARIYQAQKYYTDLKEKVKGAVNYEAIAAAADRALALETAKIKGEQAEAGAAKHKAAAQVALDAWFNLYEQMKSLGGSAVEAVNKELQKIPEMTEKIGTKSEASFKKFTLYFTKHMESGFNKMVGSAQKWFQKNKAYIDAVGQLFSIVVSGMNQIADNNFQKQVNKMDKLHSKQKAVLDQEYAEKFAALNAEELAEERAKQIAEINMSEMTEAEKAAAILSLQTQWDKQAKREALEAEYAAKQKALEEQQAKEKRKLEYDQAVMKKKSGITQAIISTALAVLSALGTNPFLPMGLIAAVLAAAAGAMQIAVIRSAPLPELAAGGVAMSRTAAVVGEAGPEAILPMQELKRMLGVSTRKNQAGSKTVNVNINAIDTRSMESFTRRAILPEIKKALIRETLTIAPNAVR